MVDLPYARKTSFKNKTVTTYVELSSSRIVTVVRLGVLRLVPKGSLSIREKSSAVSGHGKSIIVTEMVLLVSPGAKTSVPLIGT